MIIRFSETHVSYVTLLTKEKYLMGDVFWKDGHFEISRAVVQFVNAAEYLSLFTANSIPINFEDFGVG